MLTFRMRMYYIQIKVTVFFGVLWLSMVDTDARRNGRNRHRTDIRLPISSITVSRRRDPQITWTSGQKQKNPGRKRVSQKDIAKITDVFRPQRGKKNAFVVTKRQHLKKEWCKTQHFTQTVKEKGCLSRTIVNNFCYGQCNSFFIPKSDGQNIKEAAFVSCGFCKPQAYSTIRVTLLCPGKNYRLKRKRVLKIKRCRCMAQKVELDNR